MIYFFSLSSSIFSRPTFLQDKAPRNRCSRKRDSRVRDSAYGDRESGNGLVYLEGGTMRGERERGWPRFLGRRGQSEKTEMACSFRIICEPRRGLMSVFHDYRGNREACRRKAGRERETAARAEAETRRKRKQVIFYMTAWLHFPEQTSLWPSERKKTSALIAALRSTLLAHPFVPSFTPFSLFPFRSSSFRFLLLLLAYHPVLSSSSYIRIEWSSRSEISRTEKINNDRSF